MMTLESLAAGYAATIELLDERAVLLRRELRTARGSQFARIRRELTMLQQQLHEARAVAELCARYYEPGFYRTPEYTLQGDICNDDKRRHGYEDAGRDGAGVD